MRHNRTVSLELNVWNIPEISVRRTVHCHCKVMEMVSSNTQVGCGITTILNFIKILFPTLWHHQQLELLKWGRIAPRFCVYAKMKPSHLNLAAAIVFIENSVSCAFRVDSLLLSSLSVFSFPMLLNFSKPCRCLKTLSCYYAVGWFTVCFIDQLNKM